MKINLLILSIFIAINSVSAQTTHRVTLQPVDSSGYYAIQLSTEVLGRAAKDFSDLRILCDEKEVPYFVNTGSSYSTTIEYLPYPFSVTKRDKKSELLIEVGDQKISTFDIEIKNSAAVKNYSLSGSNDKKEWYGVSKGTLSGGNNNRTTSEIKKIDFPLSDYHYYKMTLNDSLSEPLNILKVEAKISESVLNQYETEIPVLSCDMVTAKGKKSNLTISFPYQYEVSRVQFQIGSPTYFSRDCNFGTISNHDQSLECNITTDTLRIAISNGDDQPLTIQSIKCYTPSASLIAYLDSAKNYTLTFGGEAVVAPTYDLSFIKHVPNELITITTDDSTIQTITKEKPKNSLVELFWKYGIWVVIALIMIQILLIVKRRLNDIS